MFDINVKQVNLSEKWGQVGSTSISNMLYKLSKNNLYLFILVNRTIDLAL